MSRFVVLSLFVLTASAAGAAEPVPSPERTGAAKTAAPKVDVPAATPRDRCPVCGMIVFDFPEWAAAVVFRDGATLHFDGVKDLFDFLGDVPRYAKGRTRADVRTIAVTDYYDQTRIDAKAALFVLGTDIRGPMGHELVPVATRAAAEELMKDHEGKRILTFDEVTPAVLALLDPPR
ncbi:nitrous oxide reductase accessory protein NosL [Myxococcota bacterium]|nr:nitrous oxide reductase accessory protein NosL [Myxococcota bacterium]